MKRSYNITRRRFLELFSTSCCGLLASCSTVPITERRQLAIYPESFINKQAAGAYINFKKKAKLITDGKDLKNITEIGEKIQRSVTSFFLKKDNADQLHILIGNMSWLIIKKSRTHGVCLEEKLLFIPAYLMLPKIMMASLL